MPCFRRAHGRIVGSKIAESQPTPTNLLFCFVLCMNACTFCARPSSPFPFVDIHIFPFFSPKSALPPPYSTSSDCHLDVEFVCPRLLHHSTEHPAIVERHPPCCATRSQLSLHPVASCVREEQSLSVLLCGWRRTCPPRSPATAQQQARKA